MRGRNEGKSYLRGLIASLSDLMGLLAYFGVLSGLQYVNIRIQLHSDVGC